MSFFIGAKDYVGYIRKIAQRIADSSEYITELDATTGDGDHWININMGFEHLLEKTDELEHLPMDEVFKTIGMIMMSKVGGSSGILYGGAYLAAGKAVVGKIKINSDELCCSLEAMVNDMMFRGKAEPGFKTMIDALYPATQAYRACLEEGKGNRETMGIVKEAAIAGATKTKMMEAVKGRASYQQNKGVGHLDPGAVTMSYQIECLCDYIVDNLL